MELNYLRSFYEVAKAGSFTAAARSLRISQSALSKSVALLEDSEGVKLFDRSKKGVALTAVGVQVFEKCSGIFQSVVEIQNTCRGIKETCEGLLRFGASDHVTNYILVKKALEMSELHPKVIPSIFSGTPNEIITAILNNELEFGLFFTRVNIPQIQYEPLFPVEMAVVCHRDLIKDSEETLTTAKLKALVQKAGFISSISAQYQSHPSQDLIDVIGNEPRVSFESSSQETQKRVCLAGGGIAFLARFMVEQELKNGSLVEVPLKQPFTLSLLLARRNGRALSLSAKTFLEGLRSPFSK